MSFQGCCLICMMASSPHQHPRNYAASRGFFLASPLACTKSFACLVLWVVGLFTSLRETLREVNKPSM